MRKNIWWLMLLLLLTPLLFLNQPGIQAAGDWTGWSNIGGQTNLSPSIISYKNTLIVGVEGTNNSPWLSMNEGNWSDWFDLQESNIAELGLTIFKNDLIFYGRSINNQILIADYTNSVKGVRKPNLQWFSVANATTPSLPTIASFNDKLYVIFRGMNSKLYFGSGKTNFKNITEIPGNGSTPSEPRAVVVNNQVWVAMRGNDNGIYINMMSSNGNWSGWKQVPGGGKTSSGPAIAQLGSRVYLMVRGTDNGIYVNYLDGGNWNGWKNIGGQTLSGPSFTVVNNTLYAAVRGTDNRVYVNSLASGNDWNNNNDNGNWWDDSHHNQNQDNDAKIVSDTIPETMVAGKSYTVSITVRNTGGNSWTAGKGYKLGAVGDSDPFALNRVALNSNIKVKPNDQVTFTFVMKAPNNPGTYTTDWQMLQENKEWFGDKLIKTIKVTKFGGQHQWHDWNDNNDNNFNDWWNDSHQDQNKENDAKIVGSNIPDTMKAGQSYNVSITVKNTGDTAWRASKGYKLARVGGPNAFCPARIEMNSNDKIKPGDQVTFSFTMTAPDSPGTFKLGWQMIQEGEEWFGDKLVREIKVNKKSSWHDWKDNNFNDWWNDSNQDQDKENDAKIVGSNIPDTMKAGQNYNVSITVKNTGDTAWRASKGYKLARVGGSNAFCPARVEMSSGDKVNPGEQVTFSFTIAAPDSAGTFKLGWQMVQEGEEWFGDKLVREIKVIKKNPWHDWKDNNFNDWWNDNHQDQYKENDAKIVGSNIPDTMKAGQSYNVSITVKNTGDTAWRASKGYKLARVGGSNAFCPARIEMNSNDKIDPGEQVTFSFTMTAPDSPGTFKIGWQMVQENEEWFGEKLVREINVIKKHSWHDWKDNNFNDWWNDSHQDQNKENDAKIVGSNIPDTMKAGQSYNVSITVKNTGDTAWRSNKGYKLARVGGSNAFCPARIEMNSNDKIDPGEQVTFSFTMTAPDSPGTFKIGWQMVQEGEEWFGDKLVREINVTKGGHGHHQWNDWNDHNNNNFNDWWNDQQDQNNQNDNDAKMVSSSIPETMTAGQSYNVSITVKNTGDNPWRSNKGYKLGSVGGTNTFSPDRIELNSHDQVDPGEQVTFKFTMTAPNNAGNYKLGWQMLQENVEWFGDKLAKNIKVVNGNNDSQQTGSSTGWSKIPGGGATLSGPAAAFFNNRLYVLVRGTDNGIYINWMAVGTWNGWGNISGATPSEGALVNYNGSLYAVVRGTDNAIYINRNPGSGFAGWGQIPGGGATPSGPAATVYNGRLYVVVRGTDSAVYINSMDSSGNWSGWSSLGGSIPSEPSVTVYQGKLMVFVRGTNDGIWLNQFNGGSWSGWAEIPGGGRTSSGPSVCTLNGHLYLVVQGTDNGIWINRLSGNDWQGWSQVPGDGRTPSGPCVVATNNGLLILVQGTDNAIYQNQLSF